MKKIDLKQTILNNKKIVISLTLIFIILIGLLFNKIISIDSYKNDIKVAKVSMKRLTANSTEITNDIKSFDKITYNVKYTLEGKNGESAKNRTAIITADITDEDLKYASWNVASGENLSSKIINDGKTLVLTVNGIDTDKEYTTPITLTVTGAPNGYNFNPIITVNESTNTNNAISTNTSSKVNSLSISGIVTDKNSNEPLNNIELLLCKVENENTCTNITTVFTKEDGSYVFGDLEEGTYKISNVNNDEYEVNESNPIVINNSGETFNISMINTGNFHAKVDKYIKKIEITENGETKTFDYNNLNKAILAVKNIKNVEAKITYEFTIINIGTKEGYVKVVKEDIPDGLIFNSNYKENQNWKEDNGILYNKTLSKEKLQPGESKTLSITLDLKNQKEAKTYLNNVIITGESYHTIVFVSDNKIIKQEEVLDSDKINSISTLKEGYIFKGWYSDIDYKNIYDFNLPILKDTALYAKWEKQKSNVDYCTVIFKHNNEIFHSETIECGNKIKEFDSPIEEGYEFKSWIDSDKNSFDINDPITTDENTYTSNFKKIADVNVSHLPVEWTKDSVIVSMNIPDTIEQVDENGNTYLETIDKDNYEIESNVDNGTYIKYEKPFIIEKNCDIYARLTKKATNEKGNNVIHKITNIDKINPTIISMKTSKISQNTFDLNMQVQDNESGIGRIVIYKDDNLIETKTYETLSQEEANNVINETYTFDELYAGTTYKINIDVYDRVGNKITSDDMNVTTTEQDHIVAQIIGRNDVLFDINDYERYKTLTDAINACTDGVQCTIKMVDDTNESNVISENKNITLDLNNYKIESNQENTLVNNGQLIVVDQSTESKGTILNTTNIGVTNNGTFTLGNNENAVSIISPNIGGTTIGLKNNATFNFYDGKIAGNVAISGLVTKTPTEYDPTITSSNNNEIAILSVLTDMEARIDNKYYLKLNDAILKAKNNDKITLLKDIELNSTINIEKTGTLTIDLNNYIIENSKSNSEAFNVNGYLINSTANLIIDDSSNNFDSGARNTGSIKINDNSKKLNIIKTMGFLTINSGTFTGCRDEYFHMLSEIDVLGTGDINVTGGEVDCIINAQTTGKINVETANINILSSSLSSMISIINDANIGRFSNKNNTSEIEIIDSSVGGGSLVGTNLVGTKIIINNSMIGAAGSISSINSDNAIIENNSVAYVSNEGTIQISDAKGGIIENFNIANIDNSTINIKNSKTLTFNGLTGRIENNSTGDITGQNLSYNGKSFSSINNKGNINVDTINYLYTYNISDYIINESGKMILENMTMTVPSGLNDSYNIFNINDGSVEIKNSTITDSSVNRTAFRNFGELTLDGVTVNSSSTYHPIIDNNSNIYIHSSDLTGSSIGINNFGNVYYYSGNLNATGISINNSSTGMIQIGDKNDEFSYDNPIIKSGSQYGIVGGIINYYDGKLIGKTYGFDGTINDYSKEKIINSETKTIDSIDYIVVSLEEKKEIAQIGDIKYTSIQDAIDACPDNNELTNIKLLDNIVLVNNNIINEGKNIIFDINGKKIDYVGNTSLFTNNGNFKIIDSSDTQEYYPSTVSTTIDDEDGNHYTYNLELSTSGNLTSTFTKTANDGTISNSTKSLSSTISNDESNDSSGNKINTTIVSDDNDNTLNIHQVITYADINNETTTDITFDSIITKYKISTKGQINSKSTGRLLINEGTGTLHISGGTIETNNVEHAIINKGSGTIQFSSGIINTKTTALYNESTGKIRITSGIININPSSTNIVYGIYNNNGGTVEITSGTINLLSSYSIGIYNNLGLTTMTGGTIKTPKTGYGSGKMEKGIINNGGTFNFSNGEISIGRVADATSYYLEASGFSNKGIINITGGTINADNVNSSTCKIDSKIGSISYIKNYGDITVTNANSINSISNYHNLDIINGNFSYISNIRNTSISATDPILNIGVKDNLVSVTNPKIDKGVGIGYGIFNFYDGIIKASTTDGGSAISGIINEVEDGYEINKVSDGSYETATLTKSTPLVKLESNGQSYIKIKDAIENAISNDTIILLRAPTFLAGEEKISVNSEKSITFDLGSFTINSFNSLFLENNGALILKNGKIIISANSSIINSGNITFDNINVSGIFTNTGVFNVINKSVLSNIQNDSVDSNSNSVTTNSVITKLTNNGNKINITNGLVSTLINNENAVIESESSYISDITNSGTMIIKKANGSGIGNLENGYIEIFDSKYASGVNSGGVFNSTNTTYSNGFNSSNNANTTITGGTISKTGKDTDSRIDYFDNTATCALKTRNSTLTLNDVTVLSYGQGTVLVSVNNSIVNINNSTLDVNKIADTSTKHYDNIVPLMIGYNSDVTVSGGTIAALSYIKNYHHEYGSAIVNENSYLTLKEDVEVKSHNYEGVSNLVRSPSETTKLATINIDAAKIKALIKNEGEINFGVQDNKNDITTPTSESVTNTGTFNLYDGKITGYFKGGINAIENGCSIEKVTNSDDIMETYLVEENIVKLSDNTEYNDLSDALEASKDEDEFTFLKNSFINASSLTIPENKNLTFNLNGKIINIYDSIINNGTLKIKDSTTSKEGTIIGAYGSGSFIINNNKLFIESGNIDNLTNKNTILNNDYIKLFDGTIKSTYNSHQGEVGKYGIYNNAGIIDIEGGNIKSYMGIHLLNGTINMSSGVFDTNMDSIENENGIVNISGGIIKINYNTAISNYGNGTLNLLGGQIINYSDYGTGGYGIYNHGCSTPTINLEGTSIKNVYNAIYNDKDIYKDDNYIPANPVINIIKGTIESERGINFNGFGILNIGSHDSIGNSEEPIISTTSNSYEGIVISNPNQYLYYDSDLGSSVYGTATISFYGGKIIGKVNKSINSYSNIVVPEGYRINTAINSENDLETKTIGIIGETDNLIKIDGLSYSDIQDAINTKCQENSECNLILQRSYTMENDITIPINKTINLYTNGYAFSYGDYTITGGTFNLINGEVPSGLLASLKSLLNINDPSYVRKNIILSKMDNGNDLSIENTYKLQTLENNKYIDLGINEDIEDVGRYTIDLDSKVYDMKTINGKLYLNSIPEGDYKLIDQDKNELIFKVNSDGKLTGNIKENYKTTTDTSTMSSATAQVMTAIQTGVTIRNYFLIFLTAILGFITLILINRKIEKEQQ